MTPDNQTPEGVSNRIKVAKKDSHMKWKDRILWFGIRRQLGFPVADN